MYSDSEYDEVCASAAYILMSCDLILKNAKARRRRCWMRFLNRSRRRSNASDLLTDLSLPSGGFENFCRMSTGDFETLLRRIGPFIIKRDTNMRQSIPIQERLAVALRFFATGDSYASLSYLFKFSKQTVSRCVDDVCLAIIAELKEEIKLPQNEEEWLCISEEYEHLWNFPNCLGAIDGKHIIQSPINPGTNFYNHKGKFSVVLLALVDAHYRFTFVDIGCQVQISDGGVSNNSTLFSKLQNGQLKLPPDRRLPSFEKKLPYVFVSDAAFALNRHIMKPYPGVFEKGSPQRIFGYRISRARRVAENAFGILGSVFRVFRRPMILDPEKVTNVTLACVLLHNFLRGSPSSSTIYTPPGSLDREIDGEVIPGSWRNDPSSLTSFLPLQKTARKSGKEARFVRDAFAEYFITTGKLPWQDK